MFDMMMIRRVIESDTELRMMFDVPEGASPQDLHVQVQGNTLQVGCGPFTLTLPIHDVDPSSIEGIFLPETSVLGVVAPKSAKYDDSWSRKSIQVAIRHG